MKKNAVIFLYNSESAPIVKYRDLLAEYNIVGLVSPKGFGLSEKDAGWACNEENLGICVCDSLDDISVKFDTIIISDIETEINFEEIIYPEILKAVNEKKNIVCLYPLDCHLYNKVADLCSSNQVYFICFNAEGDKIRTKEHNPLEKEQLLDINTPVIFVMGLMEKTNKFDIQLLLRRYFLGEGYKVSQIGTRSYCELFGFHSFPSVMYEGIPEWEKVLRFNLFCKEIELSENPDVLIVGVPGGIMPYNKKFINKFGILAFEISNALSPDAVIMSTLYDDFNEEYFQNIITSIKYKLGCEINCFNMSNNKFDSTIDDTDMFMDFMCINTQLVEKKKNALNNSCPVRIFNSLAGADSRLMPKYIENILSGYSDVDVL